VSRRVRPFEQTALSYCTALDEIRQRGELSTAEGADLLDEDASLVRHLLNDLAERGRTGGGTDPGPPLLPGLRLFKRVGLHEGLRSHCNPKILESCTRGDVAQMADPRTMGS
jgi:hypothetical protein